ncbi:MAG: glycosyltransferase family 2 protein [Myxococcota bacterium]
MNQAGQDQPSPTELRVSIVMPAYDAADHLRAVVPAALAALAGSGELVVVDAGSGDGTGRLAEELGARVIRLPERAGPARARNVGAADVDADVVLFVDADCVAHPDVVKRVRDAFTADAGLVSLCGSYDADPPHPGFASQYMNLRHHFTHHDSPGDAATFWAGCGAVRLDAFRAVGGFDAERFPRPQIEDIELGLRLAGLGTTRLDPALQVTHRKAWSLLGVIETDVRARAVPWARLILESGEMPDNLNLRRSQRIAAALAPFAILAVGVAPLAAALGRPLWLALSLAVVAGSVMLSFRLLRFFARRRGLFFAVRAWLFHQLHLTYSAAVFALCWLQHRLRPQAARTR